MRDLRLSITPRWNRTLTAETGDGGDGGGGGGGEAAAAAAAAAAASAKPYYEAFTDEALKSSPSVQKWKDPQELAGAYVALEKRYGIDPARRIDLPADPNDAEGMRAVFAKLGLPDKADGYGLKLDDKATDADKALVTGFAEAAHKLGLPAPMAHGVMKFWMEQTAAAATAQADEAKARAADGEAALKTEFGQAYEPRIREISKLVEKYGDPELAKVMNADGLKSYPNVAKMLAKLLDRMAEPGAAGGEGGDGATGDRAMTPNQARAAVAQLEGDPVKGVALRDKTHAQHKAVVDERQRLLMLIDAKPA